MRKLTLILLAACCLAGEAQRHKEWRDAAQDIKDDLKDALDARLAAKIVESAAKLTAIGRQEEAYWKKARQPDALSLARKNRTASERIAAAAKLGRFDQAVGAYGELEATCRACHDLHPEKRLDQAARRQTVTRWCLSRNSVSARDRSLTDVGSDRKSRIINDVIGAPTVREGLLRRRTAVARRKPGRLRRLCCRPVRPDI